MPATSIGDVVEDEQIVTVELGDRAFEGQLATSDLEPLHEISGAGEQHAPSILDQGEPERCRQMALAAGRPEPCRLGHALGGTARRGAQKKLRFLAERTRRIELTIVVLRTPGPPVMTSTLETSARRMAAFWLSASCRPLRCSTHGRALFGSIHGQGRLP